jgi:hypothetical protein
MGKDKYRQCKLHKNVDGNISEMVTFLPEKFASIGKVVKLKSEDGVWVDGWVVVSAGKLTEDTPDSKKAIRNHRKNTGDSLPKGNK